MNKTILEFLQLEMKKGEVFNNYINILSQNLELLSKEIEDNSNYTLVDRLSGAKLKLFCNRVGVEGSNYSDSDLRVLAKLKKYKYDSKISIIDNFKLKMSIGTGYKCEAKKSENSGEIYAKLIIPPGVSTNLINDLDSEFVFGCRVVYEIKEIVYRVYETLGNHNTIGLRGFNIEFDEEEATHTIFESLGSHNLTNIQGFGIIFEEKTGG